MPQSVDHSNDRVAAVIVLAAGAGTRMRSALPKVMHPIAGKPLLWHALAAAHGIDPDRIVAVIGHDRDRVGAYLAADYPQVSAVVQAEQHGTGHAVACALAELGAVAGTVVVTYGDVPLLTPATLRQLARAHSDGGHQVTVLSALVGDPTGYGRIVRNDAGAVVGIVEHRDATPDQRSITEINSGVYAFDGAVLADLLPRVATGNVQGEQYLTDVVGLAAEGGHRVGALQADDPVEIEGVNDRAQLAALARVLNGRIIAGLQAAGVTVLDPATTWVHVDVTVGPDTTVLPGVSLEAGTSIGAGATIGPDSTLSGCTVGDGASVVRSHCLGAEIGPGASVGPFSYLRPGAILAEGAKVGAFVEVKGSSIGVGAKVPHLSYIGDATIGPGTNIGAGTITANYDGQVKSATTIGAAVFVGTNTTLVAPVTVADGAYVAAGSTLTSDVAPGDLAIGRARQTESLGWVARRRSGTASHRAALAARERAAPPEEQV